MVEDHAVIDQQVVVVGERELGVLQQGERGEVLRMDVDDAGGVGLVEMDAGVDVERHLAQLALAAHDAPVEVADDQRRGGELVE